MDQAATPLVAQRTVAGAVGELMEACGLRLDMFRPGHVEERVERALAAEGVSSAAALAARLRRDGDARERFRRSVAVSHSGFFRDPEQFEALEQRVLPRLLEHTDRLRVWSAGCANGLELWSLAVVLDRHGALDRSELLGSDLLEENVRIARAGAYQIVEVSDAVRRTPRWERRDLVHDPPPAGGWDLVLCRNVAIYLRPDCKTTLHRRLAGALRPGGVLMLGRAERLGDPSALGLRRLEAHVYQRPR